MGQTRILSDSFNDYSLPSFLEGTVAISNNNIVIELGEGSFTLD